MPTETPSWKNSLKEDGKEGTAKAVKITSKIEKKLGTTNLPFIFIR